MEHIKSRLKALLKQADWSSEDREWLLTFLDSEDSILLREMLREAFFQDLGSSPIQRDQKSREILEKIHQRIGYPEMVTASRRSFSYKWAAIAACLILIVSTTFYLLRSDRQDQELPVVSAVKQPLINDFAPGGEKAVLTLSDGSVVILDDASNGKITQQEAVSVEKLSQGALKYAGGESSDKLAFNTISTPRGGTFQITLSDGSRVWLNAATSLKFPVNFIGTERRVELTGEAYFEIAKNKSKPFIVDVAGKQDVRVLGTHFNINSYSDERSINTTLLEGSIAIKVNGQTDDKLLTPGQQFSLFPSGKTTIWEAVNLEETVAWKEGKFDFGESMDLEQVMRQVGRWYDVDIDYKGDFSGIQIGGSISRNVSASKVFEMLEMTGVARFSISGKKVTVLAPLK